MAAVAVAAAAVAVKIKGGGAIVSLRTRRSTCILVKTFLHLSRALPSPSPPFAQRIFLQAKCATLQCKIPLRVGLYKRLAPSPTNAYATYGKRGTKAGGLPSAI